VLVKVMLEVMSEDMLLVCPFQNLAGSDGVLVQKCFGEPTAKDHDMKGASWLPLLTLSDR
jgi:hypothetical protein